MNFLKPIAQPASGSTSELSVDIGGRAHALTVRRRRGVRRLTLKLDSRTGQPQVTAPVRAKDRDILAFVDRHRDWLATQLTKQTPAIIVADGAMVPFRGQQTRLVVTGRPPRTVFETEDEIVIGGPTDLAVGRLEKFLKVSARERLLEEVAHFAPKLGVSPRSVSIRDTATRWGSCSSRGTLNFSWRLIMAPDAILSYVAAHEVAHLREMNHSPRFWQLVDQICPDWGDAKTWLKREGSHLMQIRFRAHSYSGLVGD